MGNDSEQRLGDGSIDESIAGATDVSIDDDYVDWLANAEEITPTEDQVSSDQVSSDQVSSDQVSGETTESNRSTEHRSGIEIGRIGKRVKSHYRHLPSWTLLLQIFLAAGWGRAGVAHAISRRWWNGEEILDFLATETDLRVGLYRYVLTGVVEPLPTVTAVVVVLAELTVAVLLAVNYRVNMALAVAAFLNVQFMLAGVVNPSIFYLVASLGIAIWRLETSASPQAISRLTRLGIGFGFAASLLLAPSVRTIRPATAIEDPALVLIFLIVLSAASLWWANHRRVLAGDTLTELIGDDHGTGRPRERPISLVSLIMAALATVAILVAGFVMAGEQDAEPDNGGPDHAGAGSESAELGSLGRPYAVGQDVTLSYDDPETGTVHQWQVQVVDALILDGDRLGLSSPIGDSRLALAQIRLTASASAQRTVDLRFTALDQSGRPVPESTEGCGERAALPPRGTELTASGEIEGWMCWWVSATDLRSLLLAVEVEAAEGTVYLSLGRD